MIKVTTPATVSEMLKLTIKTLDASDEFLSRVEQVNYSDGTTKKFHWECSREMQEDLEKLRAFFEENPDMDETVYLLTFHP